jgi:hypothetical protein
MEKTARWRIENGEETKREIWKWRRKQERYLEIEKKQEGDLEMEKKARRRFGSRGESKR